MEGEDSMKQSKLWIAVQIAGFVGIFLLLLVPVSYMVRTNGDVKGPFFRILCGEERLAGYRDDRIKSCVPLLCGAEAVGGDRDRHVSAVF